MPESGRRPRVAIIVRRFGAQFGGLEACAEHLVRQLGEAYDMHVFCQEWGSDLPVARTIVPRIERLPAWLNLLHFTWRCRVLASGFDLLHSHENSWLGDVHSVHMMPVRFSRCHQRRGWRRYLSTWTSPRLLGYLAMEAGRYRIEPRREIVAVSPLTLAQIETAYERHPRITVIPPGVEAPSSTTNRGEALGALGLSVDRRYAILVAHDPIRKGLNTLLAALPRLSAAVDLIVVGGDDDTVARVGALAVRAGQSTRVHAWPLQRDLSLFYTAADVCAFPTTDDAFGMVPLEAMSYGRPAIISSKTYCGFAYYVEQGIDAIVLDDPNDAAGLTGALDRLLADRTLYERLVRNGKRLASEMSWANAAAGYARIYQRILSQSSRPGALPAAATSAGDETVHPAEGGAGPSHSLN